MTVIARHLIIKGHVQGVWYRAWTVETARGLGLAGWVRNCRNGDVEAVVEGAETTIDRFLAMAWDGPPAARVSGIEIAQQPVAALEGFQKRSTV